MIRPPLHHVLSVWLAMGQGALAVTPLSIIFAPHSADAQGQKRVEDHLQSARRLYDNLEYERALKQISSARPLATRQEDAVQLSLLEGIILAEMGRDEASDKAFQSALFIQPDAALPVIVSPKVVQRFEDIRQQVKRGLEAAEATRTAEGTQQKTKASPVDPIPSTVRTSSPHSLRDRAWIPATIGGALVIGGGISYALARHEQSLLRSDDASLSTREEAHRSASRGRTFQTVGLGLVGAGILGLGSSLGMLLLGSPSETRAPNIALTTNGTSAIVAGRWP